MRTSTRILGKILPALVLSVATVAFASGPHKATVFARGGSKSGLVTWKPASRAYEINDGRISVTVDLRDVTGIRLAQQPAELPAAVSSGNIAQLKKIMDDYEMFGPDQAAAQALVKAYLNNGQPGQAVTLCESLFKKNPGMGGNAEVRSAYWDALRKANMLGKLRADLIKALQEGDRPMQAAACLQRGHLEREAGDMRKALIDGYLRCVVMYQNVKSVQPEGLYWAFKCHQTLNEHNYAERWRTKLSSEYASSSWAKKLVAN